MRNEPALSQGQFKLKGTYLASLQSQTSDQLAEIEKQRIESGDASKGLLELFRSRYEKLL